MKLIPIEYAKPGDIIARNIYDSNGMMLLSKGVVLQQKYIDKLIQMGFLLIYVEDEMLKDVEVKEIINESTRMEAVSLIRESFLKIEFNENLDKLDGIKKKIRVVIDKMVEDIIESKKGLISLMDIKSFDDYLYTHSVNVSILCGLIGFGLKFNQDKVRSIMLGALYHDIGRTKIPKEIWNKPGRLTEEEMAEVKKHPEIGYEIISKHNFLTAVEGMAVLQHHEKIDGSGYPDGRSGDDIHIFGKIASVVDVYDALISNRPFRKALKVYEAIEYINSMKGVFFDKSVVETLKSIVAPYPIGTIVMLNTGERGFVIKENPNFIDKPIVRIFNDGQSIRIANIRDVDLSVEDSLRIVRVL